MSDFWSRRKAAVAAEDRAETEAQAAALAAAEEARLAERTDADILEDLGLPDPDEMVAPEQVRALLGAAVPQRLKTRALRRLWRLNPVLANVDGLVDYGGDFTDSATVLDTMQTVYQVGKGMSARIQQMVEEAEARAAAEEAEEPAETVAAEDLPEPELVADPMPAPTPEPALTATDTPEDEAPVLAASSRRMRFRFDPVT
jgi:hypothetical protein